MSKVRQIACPCCGYATLTERGGFEICKYCFWEDDGQDNDDADDCLGGPNHISLTEERINFIRIGASNPKDLKHCIAPPDNEVKGDTIHEILPA